MFRRSVASRMARAVTALGIFTGKGSPLSSTIRLKKMVIAALVVKPISPSTASTFSFNSPSIRTFTVADFMPIAPNKA